MKLKEKIEISKKVIKLSHDNWGENLGFAFTGRKDSTVVMHIAKTVIKNPKCMFIDHGLHFKESYENLENLIKQWNLNVEYVADKNYLEKLNAEKDSQKRSIILRELKIQTIKNWIIKNKIKALASAIRWDENPARSWEKYFSRRGDHIRIHPILHWNEEDVWEYIHTNNIPYNKLYDQGYRSIGAQEFTSRPDSDDERSGRDSDKEEVMDRLRSLGYF